MAVDEADPARGGPPITLGDLVADVAAAEHRPGLVRPHAIPEPLLDPLSPPEGSSLALRPSFCFDSLHSKLLSWLEGRFNDDSTLSLEYKGFREVFLASSSDSDRAHACSRARPVDLTINSVVTVRGLLHL